MSREILTGHPGSAPVAGMGDTAIYAWTVGSHLPGPP